MTNTEIDALWIAEYGDDFFVSAAAGIPMYVDFFGDILVAAGLPVETAYTTAREWITRFRSEEFTLASY